MGWWRAAVRGLAGVIAAAAVVVQAHGAQLAPWTGDAPPPLELEDIAGKRHALADYAGKVVLVNFWATWCEPCRAEMPSMERLRQRYPQSAFSILAVNVDEPEQRIRAFLERTALGFTVLADPGMRVTRAWSARVLPSSFLIGRDGRIRYSVRGDLDWSSEPIVRVVDALVAGK